MNSNTSNCVTAGCSQSANSTCDTTSTDATYGVCVACLNDAQCASVENGTRPYCTPDGCKQCLTNANCTALNSSYPYCEEGGCIQCETYADCDGGQGCNVAFGVCGFCLTNSDCPSAVPTCNSSDVCQ